MNKTLDQLNEELRKLEADPACRATDGALHYYTPIARVKRAKLAQQIAAATRARRDQQPTPTPTP